MKLFAQDAPQGKRFSAPQAAIRAELLADNTCSALGTIARGPDSYFSEKQQPRSAGFFIGALSMQWMREGADWVLKFNRRKLGRVFLDGQWPGMWRSRRADGQLSDMANLSWAKAAVLAAAERDILPPKSPVKRTVFETNGDEAQRINLGPRQARVRRTHLAYRERLPRLRLRRSRDWQLSKR